MELLEVTLAGSTQRNILPIAWVLYVLVIMLPGIEKHGDRGDVAILNPSIYIRGLLERKNFL